jgi:hypothetical protein
MLGDFAADTNTATTTWAGSLLEETKAAYPACTGGERGVLSGVTTDLKMGVLQTRNTWTHGLAFLRILSF